MGQFWLLWGRVNEFGQVIAGARTQAHPIEGLVIGVGLVFVFYLLFRGKKG